MLGMNEKYIPYDYICEDMGISASLWIIGLALPKRRKLKEEADKQ